MTITNTRELLSIEERSDKQRQLFALAAAMVNKCGEVVPSQVRCHLFPFAANILFRANKLEMVINGGTDPEPGELSMATTLAQLGHSEEDVEVDKASQALLARISSGFSTAVVESARKGETFAREVTTYALEIGEAALEVIRIRSLSEPGEPITYTLNTAAPATED